jgi:hypothetical protein
MDSIQQRITGAVKNSFDKDGANIVEALRQRVLDTGKLATGDLYNSITYNTDVYDTTVILEINAADYFKNVDAGRGAGKKFPPIDKILQWVQVRGITLRSGLTSKKQKGSIDRQQRNLAFIIARSIAKNGIDPANLKSGLQPILDTVSSNMSEAINKTTQEIIAEMAGNAFTKAKTNFTVNRK